ncbi:MAG: CCA tRNA nucleotidyltransferase [Alphaproteobacteria bacterium]
MIEAGRLDARPWMAGKATRAVMLALSANGKPARFVGGCVRDALLDRPVKDVDIATPERPEEVMRLLDAAGIRAIPTGIKHGTVTAVIGRAHFEITSLRRDVETFGRHARVAFTDDWEEDAARRDFTMNALFCDPDGTLYDPTGGRADLEDGRVRFVGDAAARIEEDVLRLLRFFRFHGWYGKGAPDAAALDACRALASGLAGLSAERVWSELRRLLAAPDPASVLHLMETNTILAHVLAEADRIPRLAALCALEDRLGLAPDPLRRLAAVITTDGDGALARRLRLSRADGKRLHALTAPDRRPNPAVATLENRITLYRLGPERFRDLVLIGWAGGAGKEDDALWQALWALPETNPMPKFPLAGRDALAAGVPKGPRVGLLLADIEAWWIEGGFTADRKACLAQLRSRL